MPLHPGRDPEPDRPDGDRLDEGHPVTGRPAVHGRRHEGRRRARCACPAGARTGCCRGADPDEGRDAARRILRDAEQDARRRPCPAERRRDCCPGGVQDGNRRALWRQGPELQPRVPQTRRPTSGAPMTVSQALRRRRQGPQTLGPQQLEFRTLQPGTLCRVPGSARRRSPPPAPKRASCRAWGQASPNRVSAPRSRQASGPRAWRHRAWLHRAWGHLRRMPRGSCSRKRPLRRRGTPSGASWPPGAPPWRTGTSQIRPCPATWQEHLWT